MMRCIFSYWSFENLRTKTWGLRVKNIPFGRERRCTVAITCSVKKPLSKIYKPILSKKNNQLVSFLKGIEQKKATAYLNFFLWVYLLFFFSLYHKNFCRSSKLNMNVNKKLWVIVVLVVVINNGSPEFKEKYSLFTQLM